MNRFIHETYGRDICRRCINRLYGARLQSADCRYGIPYPQICPRCGKMRNIVTGLRLRGRWKLLGKRPV